MLFRGIIAVFRENPKKHRNSLCVKNAVFLIIKGVVQNLRRLYCYIFAAIPFSEQFTDFPVNR
jgi:hypothetical protein